MTSERGVRRPGCPFVSGCHSPSPPAFSRSLSVCPSCDWQVLCGEGLGDSESRFSRPSRHRGNGQRLHPASVRKGRPLCHAHRSCVCLVRSPLSSIDFADPAASGSHLAAVCADSLVTGFLLCFVIWGVSAGSLEPSPRPSSDTWVPRLCLPVRCWGTWPHGPLQAAASVCSPGSAEPGVRCEPTALSRVAHGTAASRTPRCVLRWAFPPFILGHVACQGSRPAPSPQWGAAGGAR